MVLIRRRSQNDVTRYKNLLACNYYTSCFRITRQIIWADSSFILEDKRTRSLFVFINNELFSVKCNPIQRLFSFGLTIIWVHNYWYLSWPEYLSENDFLSLFW